MKVNVRFPLLWFAIAAFIIYGQAVSFDYSFLDDHTLIMNRMEQLKSPAAAVAAFGEDAFHTPAGKGYYYRPVLTVTFVADAMAGQGNFAMFHFSNILYHILAAFLLFLLLAETGFDRVRSFLFSMIFLVHPLAVQAVAWVPGRNDTLLALFAFASFLFLLKYLDKKSIPFLALHLLFFALALFTKENAVILPVMIVLYGLFRAPAPWKKYLPASAGWILLTLGWFLARQHAVKGMGNVPLTDQLVSMAKNLPALLPFLGKALFPFDLAVYPILADMTTSLVLGVVAAALLLLLAWFTMPKHRLLILFGLAWFVAFLVPSFVSINNRIPNFSEHRAYLSLAGILLMVMATDPVRNINFSRRMPIFITSGLILVFGVLSYLHTRTFRDRFSFWENAVKTSPSHAFNFNNLGAMYFLENNFEKAEPLFRKSLDINPFEPMANSNAGLVCMRTNRPAEAEKYYLEEIRINPTFDHAYFNLGLLYFNHNRQEEGIAMWEKTLTVNPAYADAFKALLFAYEKSGRKEEYARIADKAREAGITP